MYTVLDADGLYLVEHDLQIIKGYRRAVLTPNVMEFKRLSEAVQVDPSTPAEKRASMVSKALGGVLIVQKGTLQYERFLHKAEPKVKSTSRCQRYTGCQLNRIGGECRCQ
jgi:NAD(P)H-hydrate repair Nnr-like enzyme with NAD(P)H-hydrate dehydratase domain